MLCSDGLHGYVQEDEIPGLLTADPQQSVARLIDLANQRGGRDNITAVVVDVT